MPDTGFVPVSTSFPELGEEEVHVWLADLDCQREESFADILTADEQARAARFHFEKDRKHYIAARGVLRCLLGDYLGVPGKSLALQYTEHGKPWLPPMPGMKKLEFNLSHSHGLALYGFTLERRIGVDIEWMERKTTVEELAQRFFAPVEVEALMAMPKERRRKAFFNGWTRKEAFIKADGQGLSLGLDTFAVSLDHSPALLSMDGDPLAPSRWTLREFATREGYAAALAVEGPIRKLNCWEFISREGESPNTPTTCCK